jgi:peptidylprolyl isomerase domain and WD repeat-containing protein 1
VTNRVVRLLGKDETVRWMNLSLYQGAPAKKGITTVAMAASANPILADKAARDPTLFCTSLKRQRFYMFTRSEPEYVLHLHLCPLSSFLSFLFCCGL